jgi:CubicO group peptidase (beta-lactamase class C family)
MKELYDKNIFGPMGMKGTQFPVDREIQSPVLHAFTLDRNFYEDCTNHNEEVQPPQGDRIARWPPLESPKNRISGLESMPGFSVSLLFLVLITWCRSSGFGRLQPT